MNCWLYKGCVRSGRFLFLRPPAFRHQSDVRFEGTCLHTHRAKADSSHRGEDDRRHPKESTLRLIPLSGINLLSYHTALCACHHQTANGSCPVFSGLQESDKQTCYLFVDHWTTSCSESSDGGGFMFLRGHISRSAAEDRRPTSTTHTANPPPTNYFLLLSLISPSLPS